MKTGTMVRDMRVITGWELFHMPEWRALLDRLGVPAEFHTMRLTIDSGERDDIVQITHVHCAVDMSSKEGINTSTMHDRRYVTWMENPRLQADTESNVPPSG